MPSRGLLTYTLIVMVSAMVLLAPAASALTFMDLYYGGGDDDSVWSAHLTSDGGVAISATTMSFGVPTYEPLHMGALWALFVNEQGYVVRSVVVDLGVPAAYYSSELVGYTLYSVGTTQSYQGVIVGVSRASGVVMAKSVSVAGDRLFLTAVRYYEPSGSLIVAAYDVDRGSMVLMSLGLDGSVEWAYDINFGSYMYTIPFGMEIVGDAALIVGYYPGFALLFNLTSQSLVWAETLSLSSTYDTFLYDVEIVGDVWVAAGTLYQGADTNGVIVVGDVASGSILAVYNVSSHYKDYLFGVHVGLGKAYVVGYANTGGVGGNDTLVVTLDLATLEPESVYLSGIPRNDWAYSIVSDRTGTPYIVGGLGVPGSGEDVWIARLSPTTGRIVGCPYTSNVTPGVAVAALSSSPASPTLTDVTSQVTLTDLTYTVKTPSVQGTPYCTPRVGGELAGTVTTSPHAAPLAAVAAAVAALALMRARRASG